MKLLVVIAALLLLSGCEGMVILDGHYDYDGYYRYAYHNHDYYYYTPRPTIYVYRPVHRHGYVRPQPVVVERRYLEDREYYHGQKRRKHKE